MIDQLYLSPWYWGSVVLLVAGASILTKSRVLGFRFICIVLLSQYLVHSAIAFGLLSPIALFCSASWFVFVGASLPVVRRLLPAWSIGASSSALFRGRFGRAVFNVARLFLVGFWTARLIAYPFSLGDLRLGDRLAAQQDDRVLFFLAQVTLPALAACMAVWLRRGRRLTWLDLAAILLTVIGLIGSDSKATLLPIVLTFFGAMEMLGRRLRDFRRLAIPAGVVAALAVVRLVLYFPQQGPLGVANTVLYRIAANTDSLEYLLVSRLDPTRFPFAGLPALIPYVSKAFGYRYDYSPGVWLYGVRYEDFSGFGPNSGPVLDYFGNLSWWGLAAPLVAALVLNLLRGRSSPQAVGLASIVYLGFVDVTLLDLPILFWGAVAVLLAALCWRPVPRLLIGSAIGRLVGSVARRIDSPISVGRSSSRTSPADADQPHQTSSADQRTLKMSRRSPDRDSTARTMVRSRSIAFNRPRG